MHSRSYVWLPTLILLLFGSVMGVAQKRANGATDTNKPFASPKLVVGIVVDQMRYDYLTRFWGHFGDDGFKRLVNGGFTAQNHHFNYAPTSTGPGHASIYTGTTPSVHGILGNNWFDKNSGQVVYCASDDSVSPVGTGSDVGKMSPHRLRVTTITDELRLHTQMRGKVIAVALKDRGSVLPAGHTANAAYWFHGGSEGRWISSSYYMEALPAWVADYNASKKLEQYKRSWEPAKDITTYVESGPDNNPYEGSFKGKQSPAFPYDLPALWDANGRYDLLKDTPYGNSITTDFALAVLEKELLGKDTYTDFLAISYSSTDYIGHKFGVNSKEVQDAYVRLDAELERLLKALDKEVGMGEYTLFLTADHGAIHVPAYLRDLKIPAGYEDASEFGGRFEEFLKYTYGTTDIVIGTGNDQLFLDHELMKSLELNPREVQEQIAAELLTYKGVEMVYTAHQMHHQEYSHGIASLLQNGYNQKLSGDVLWVSSPGFTSYSPTGSSHGSPQIYDTHVPLLLYGRGIKAGRTTERTEIPDIAPTLSVLLGITFPNGATGQPISSSLE